MTNDLDDKVKNIIAITLNVPADKVTSDLAIGDIPEWDSVANVRILQLLEETFDIEINVIDALDAEDVFDFTKLVKTYLA